MRYTIVAAAGRRVEVTESPTSPGQVKLAILNADRSPVAVCTMSPVEAGILSDALNAVASFAEHAPAYRAAAAKAGAA